MDIVELKQYLPTLMTERMKRGHSSKLEYPKVGNSLRGMIKEGTPH